MNRTSLGRSVALAATLGALAALVGCSDNRLPPVPVPKAEQKSQLPRWYPEKAWTAKEGQSQIYIEGKIVFQTGSATIHKFGETEKVLKTLLAFVNEHPEVTRLRIEGHTDDNGAEDKNQDLSARRALSVCNWLVDNGVSHLRLLAVGFGETKPIAPNELEMGRAENRRTEFHVAEVDGKPFLGKDPTGGGMVLDVPSLEERKAEEEARKKPVIAVVPTLNFKPTGNEVKKVQDKQISLDPTQKKPEQKK
ncbi:OmpA family protein [Polyangium mundeleinium]|uniref:OmpA family protein n=1 Tax=Polyangium mundeleinium TaxID=2995306 RepID=A0ABT5EL67_9BACT|nr:OmpA family protein [Polyangium mundeleinium]MDC0742117.1 OmpA family protein [Polyangium mundeleinium]